MPKKISAKRQDSYVPKKKRGERSTRNKPRQSTTEEVACYDEMETGEGMVNKMSPGTLRATKMRTLLSQ